MNLMRRFVHASLMRASKAVPSYPGGVPGALSNQPAPANNAPISTPPANQNNRQQQATPPPAIVGRVAHSGMKPVTTEVDRTIRPTKMNVGDVQRLSVAVVVNYKTTPDGKPLPLSNEQMKQVSS